MKAAVLFSGGKDSAMAVKYCFDQGWDVTLVSIKPPSDEAYIWHYPTVELTKLQARSMGLPHIYLECGAIGPKEEVAVLEDVFAQGRWDAVVLGGVGLQETQVREVRKVAEKYGIETMVPHSTFTSVELLELELDAGLDIVITEVAAGGLPKELLGKKLDATILADLKQRSAQHGFDILGEGGAYNTFVQDAPFFSAKVAITNARVIWDEKTRSGHVVAEGKLVEKIAAQYA